MFDVYWCSVCVCVAVFLPILPICLKITKLFSEHAPCYPCSCFVVGSWSYMPCAVFVVSNLFLGWGGGGEVFFTHPHRCCAENSPILETG